MFGLRWAQKTKPCLWHLELFSARLPVKVFKTLNGRQSYILSKFRSPLNGKERIKLDIISIHQRKVKIALPCFIIMHQSIPAAPSTSPPHLLTLSVPGEGICKFCAARGPDICQPRGHSWAFDTRAVCYQKITTQRILLGKKADWLICQGHEKLKRFVKACSWFYACISSLLIEPELHSEIGSYRRESTFFGYWIKFLLRLFEKHPFIFIKLFITYNLTALYYFNVNNFTSILKL